ncbi:hypothetical protein A3F55_00600 [Candidatus Adlerbacteria bacterium RIFCSPHIGHO2_12_FULL_53_18]|uniref:Uncharacterized protein n=1 Tax=Candidatus Adlerbacteria bacterium RIFCSPHIGHO2_12_FULL_53_18 TaxID=1797242 RepID=A0A1F4XTV0_9BACT|nr:MAG: hypothetical protein A3F55_00600 [Candidatus Adlerbacteria bacterium RIFCSPHIGHO2_12_FULL_53_18]
MAVFFDTTTAQRNGEGVASSLTESTAPRRPRPRASTSFTSALRSRRVFASIFLNGYAGAAPAAAAYKRFSPTCAALAAKKPVRTGAFALFWLICL